MSTRARPTPVQTVELAKTFAGEDSCVPAPLNGLENAVISVSYTFFGERNYMSLTENNWLKKFRRVPK